MIPLIESILKYVVSDDEALILTGKILGNHFEKMHDKHYVWKKVSDIITKHEKAYSITDVKYAVHMLFQNKHIDKLNADDFLQVEIKGTWEGEVAYMEGFYALKRLNTWMKVWNFINPLTWFK
jgi:hypothetical protein